MCRTKHVSIAILGMVFILSRSSFAGDRQEDRGLTFELGVGLGYWQVIPEGHDLKTSLLPFGTSLGLGYFIHDNFSLSVRAFANLVAQDDSFQPGEFKEPVTHYFIGPNFQYWIDDELFFGGGVGYTGDGPEESGVGINLRTGFPITFCSGFPLRVSLEVFARFVEDYVAFGEVIGLEVQFY
jgi:hypothetical protein